MGAIPFTVLLCCFYLGRTSGSFESYSHCEDRHVVRRISSSNPLWRLFIDRRSIEDCSLTFHEEHGSDMCVTITQDKYSQMAKSKKFCPYEIKIHVSKNLPEFVLNKYVLEDVMDSYTCHNATDNNLKNGHKCYHGYNYLSVTYAYKYRLIEMATTPDWYFDVHVVVSSANDVVFGRNMTTTTTTTMAAPPTTVVPKLYTYRGYTTNISFDGRRQCGIVHVNIPDNSHVYVHGSDNASDCKLLFVSRDANEMCVTVKKDSFSKRMSRCPYRLKFPWPLQTYACNDYLGFGRWKKCKKGHSITITLEKIDYQSSFMTDPKFTFILKVDAKGITTTRRYYYDNTTPSGNSKTKSMPTGILVLCIAGGIIVVAICCVCVVKRTSTSSDTSQTECNRDNQMRPYQYTAQPQHDGGGVIVHPTVSNVPPSYDDRNIHNNSHETPKTAPPPPSYSEVMENKGRYTDSSAPPPPTLEPSAPPPPTLMR